jgi:hypothetical protein
MTDHDLAAAIGFGLIPVLALLFVIAKWITDPRMAFPLLSVIAILVLSFFIGSAMQSTNLKGLAVIASGMGKAAMALAPWIAGVAIAVVVAVVVVEVARSMPKEAFVPVVATLAPAVAVGVCAIWAKTENLLIFGIIAVLALLVVGFCALCWTLHKGHQATLEAFRMQALQAPPPAPQRLEVHRGNLLPVKRSANGG